MEGTMPKLSLEETRKMSKSLQSVLDEWATQQGATVELGKVTYGNRFEVKLTVNPDGIESELVEDFKEMAEVLGLNPDDLGALFTHKGEVFEVMGYLRNARKYHIACRSQLSGEQYHFTADMVAQGLARNRKRAAK